MKKENNLVTNEENMDKRLENIEKSIKKVHKQFKIFFIVFIALLIIVIVKETVTFFDFLNSFNTNTAVVYCSKANQNNIYKIRYNKENNVVSFYDNNNNSTLNNVYIYGEKIKTDEDVNELISNITNVHEKNGQSCNIEYYDKYQNKLVK